MRVVILFAFVMLMHLAVTVALVIYVFGAGMARFDSGTAASPSEALAGSVLSVLMLPLLPALGRFRLFHGPGLIGYVPFMLNAAVWGVAVVAFWRLLLTWRRVRRGRRTR